MTVILAEIKNLNSKCRDVQRQNNVEQKDRFKFYGNMTWLTQKHKQPAQ